MKGCIAGRRFEMPSLATGFRKDHLDSLDATGKVALHTTLPHSYHSASRFLQGFRNEQVPLSIPCNFLFPVTNVCLRNMSATGATVPEASVHENRNPKVGKEEIWNAEHALFMQAPPPDAVPDQARAEAEFRRLVTIRTNSPHVFAPGGLVAELSLVTGLVYNLDYARNATWRTDSLNSGATAPTAGLTPL